MAAKDTSLGDLFKTWVSPAVIIIGLISVFAVGHYRLDENEGCIKRNTEDIKEVQLYQREVKTEMRHMNSMLQKIDRKLDK